MPKIIFSKELLADPTSQYAIFDDSWPKSMVSEYEVALLEHRLIIEKEIIINYYSKIKIFVHGFYTCRHNVTKDNEGNYWGDAQIDNLVVGLDSDYRNHASMGLYETMIYRYSDKCPKIPKIQT